MISVVKLLAMPAATFMLARLLGAPPLAGGVVVVLFAAMPTG